jgi:hypothetical protein
MPKSLGLVLLTLSCAVACGEPKAPVAPEEPAGVPSSTTAPTAPPHTAPMPRQLGGMQLGMPADKFVGKCTATGAKALPSAREDTLLCTVPPEPMPAKTPSVAFDGVILGVFCGPRTTACQLTYVIYGKAAERDDQIRELVGDLTNRFGPPTSAEGPGEPGRACGAGKSPVHFTRSWQFGPKPHPTGAIRLEFDCDALNLFYDDEAWIRSGPH